MYKENVRIIDGVRYVKRVVPCNRIDYNLSENPRAVTCKNIERFLNDMTENNANGEALHTDIYDAYVNYCKHFNLEYNNEKVFGAALRYAVINCTYEATKTVTRIPCNIFYINTDDIRAGKKCPKRTKYKCGWIYRGIRLLDGWDRDIV